MEHWRPAVRNAESFILLHGDRIYKIVELQLSYDLRSLYYCLLSWGLMKQWNMIWGFYVYVNNNAVLGFAAV
jgi:hypothetical protein